MQRLVIKTKSVEFMPFFLSLFVFLCGTSWFIFGLLGRDPFLFVSTQQNSLYPFSIQLFIFYAIKTENLVTGYSTSTTVSASDVCLAVILTHGDGAILCFAGTKWCGFIIGYNATDFVFHLPWQ